MKPQFLIAGSAEAGGVEFLLQTLLILYAEHHIGTVGVPPEEGIHIFYADVPHAEKIQHGSQPTGTVRHGGHHHVGGGDHVAAALQHLGAFRRVAYQKTQYAEFGGVGNGDGPEVYAFVGEGADLSGAGSGAFLGAVGAALALIGEEAAQ